MGNAWLYLTQNCLDHPGMRITEVHLRTFGFSSQCYFADAPYSYFVYLQSTL